MHIIIFLFVGSRCSFIKKNHIILLTSKIALDLELTPSVMLLSNTKIKEINFMTNSIALNKTTVKTKTLLTVAAVISAVLLPQIFHIAGMTSGLGAAPGAAFLPMQLPVLLAGLLAGPLVGLIAGILSPLVSFTISGMPSAVMLPNIIAELAGYGFMAGLLWHVKMPVFGKLLIAQIAGHVTKALVILLSVYAMKNQSVPTSLIWTSVTAGLPGILLQWALIPLILFRVQNRDNGHV